MTDSSPSPEPEYMAMLRQREQKRRRRRRNIYVGLAFLVGLVVLDEIVAHIADKSLRRTDAAYKELMDVADLDFERNGRHSFGKTECFFRRKFRIYSYQVCFYPENNMHSPIPEWKYSVIYTPPKALISFWFPASGPKNYYFRSTEMFGDQILFIQNNGAIVRINKHGNE